MIFSIYFLTNLLNVTKLLGKDNKPKDLSHEKYKVKHGLVGKVTLGPHDRPYCFINSDGEQSFFCFKSDLPADTKGGSEVIFDAIPSFDKKKNKESWRASNVRLCTRDKRTNSK